MQTNGHWVTPFLSAAAQGYKVSINDRAGCCLAFANWDADVVDSRDRILGTGWHEYIEPADLPALLAWFADDGTTGPITYRGIGRIDGRATTVNICLVKAWVGDAWLSVGASEPATVIPFSPDLPSQEDQEQA